MGKAFFKFWFKNEKGLVGSFTFGWLYSNTRNRSLRQWILSIINGNTMNIRCWKKNKIQHTRTSLNAHKNNVPYNLLIHHRNMFLSTKHCKHVKNTNNCKNKILHVQRRSRNCQARVGWNLSQSRSSEGTLSEVAVDFKNIIGTTSIPIF
jgi:hypothetical protein